MTKLIALSLSLLFVSASAAATSKSFGNGKDNNKVDIKLCEQASKGGVLLMERDDYRKADNTQSSRLRGVRIYLYQDNVYTLNSWFKDHWVNVTCRRYPKYK